MDAIKKKIGLEGVIFLKEERRERVYDKGESLKCKERG